LEFKTAVSQTKSLADFELHPAKTSLKENPRPYTKALSCGSDFCAASDGKGITIFSTIGKYLEAQSLQLPGESVSLQSYQMGVMVLTSPNGIFALDFRWKQSRTFQCLQRTFDHKSERVIKSHQITTETMWSTVTILFIHLL
jgi:hypothetical protein